MGSVLQDWPAILQESWGGGAASFFRERSLSSGPQAEARELIGAAMPHLARRIPTGAGGLTTSAAEPETLQPGLSGIGDEYQILGFFS